MAWCSLASPRFSRTRPEIGQSAASADEHADERCATGVGTAEIAELRAAAVIG
jgi:hypothetical protein